MFSYKYKEMSKSKNNKRQEEAASRKARIQNDVYFYFDKF